MDINKWRSVYLVILFLFVFPSSSSSSPSPSSSSSFSFLLFLLLSFFLLLLLTLPLLFFFLFFCFLNLSHVFAKQCLGSRRSQSVGAVPVPASPDVRAKEVPLFCPLCCLLPFTLTCFACLCLPPTLF